MAVNHTYDGTSKPIDRALRDLRDAGLWTAVMTHLGAARVADASFRNPEATQQMKDEAIIRYARELELMYAAITQLCETGAAGRITNLLCGRR